MTFAFDTIMIESLLLPTVAFAAVAPGDVCAIGDTGYANFADALAAVKDGDTIKLLANIDYSNGITISGKSVTFDLDSKYTLNCNTSSESALRVMDGGEVKMLNEVLGTAEFNVTGVNFGVFTGYDSVANVSSATGTGNAEISGVGVQVVARSSVKVTGDVIGGIIGVYAFSSVSLQVIEPRCPQCLHRNDFEAAKRIT